MTFNSPLARTVATLFLAALTTACTAASMTRLGPQSHFVYPNSNVKQLGPVKVKKRGDVRLFVPDNLRTAESDRDLYDAAIRQVQGANLITDYAVTARTKWVYLYYIYLFWNEYELQGTAARMEVGQQELK